MTAIEKLGGTSLGACGNCDGEGHVRGPVTGRDKSARPHVGAHGSACRLTLRPWGELEFAGDSLESWATGAVKGGCCLYQRVCGCTPRPKAKYSSTTRTSTDTLVSVFRTGDDVVGDAAAAVVPPVVAAEADSRAYTD